MVIKADNCDWIKEFKGLFCVFSPLDDTNDRNYFDNAKDVFNYASRFNFKKRSEEHGMYKIMSKIYGDVAAYLMIWYDGEYRDAEIDFENETLSVVDYNYSISYIVDD